MHVNKIKSYNDKLI